MATLEINANKLGGEKEETGKKRVATSASFAESMLGVIADYASNTGVSVKELLKTMRFEHDPKDNVYVAPGLTPNAPGVLVSGKVAGSDGLEEEVTLLLPNDPKAGSKKPGNGLPFYLQITPRQLPTA